MRLVDVEFKGFASYADKTYIKFPEGLIGVIGCYKNNERESVGAGKSTIFMTLLYTLFADGAFKSVSEVINDSYSEKEHMYAKWRYILNNNEYTVERGILNGASYLDFFENGNPVGENKIPSRNKKILDTLGWDFDMFTASIFFEQDKLSKLVDADGTKRREYIEKVLNTRNWNTYQKSAEPDLRAIEKNFDNNNLLLKKCNEELDSLKKELSNYSNIDSQIKEVELEISKIEESITNNKIELDKIQNRNLIYSTSKNKYISFEKNIAQYEESITKKQTDLKNAKEQIISYEEDIKSRLQLNETLPNEIVEILNDIDLLTKKQKDLIKNQKIYEVDYAEVLSELKQQEKRLHNFDNHICENCEQELAEEYQKNKQEEVIDAINLCNVKIKRDKQEIEITSRRLTDLENNLKIQQEKKNKKEIELSNNNIFIKTKQENIETQKLIITSYQQEIQLLCTKLNEERKTFKNFIKDTSLELNKTIKNITDLEINQEEQLLSSNLNKSLVSSNEELKIKTKELNTFFSLKGQKTNIEQNIKKLVNDNITYEQNNLSFLDDIKILKYVIKGFKEIPSIIFDTVVRDLENYANEYISKFIPSMKVSIIEDRSKSNRPIEISYKFKDKERSYRMLSGGQKTIANLGLRLGFSRKIAEQTNVASQFILLDEPFGYLDEHHRDLVKNVLADLQKYYRQIIVISHIDNVPNFPHIIKVMMDNGKSSIV